MEERKTDDSLDLNSEDLIRIRELYDEKELLEAYSLMSKNKAITMVLAFFFAPLGYAYIKRYEFMLLSILTLNFFFLGFIIGPLHIYQLYTQAEEKLRLA